MLYSNACAYAIRALARLALLRPDGYVLLDELCAGSDLPRHFVAKIFQDLVRKNLLVSAKGRGGGFALAKPPATISLKDIVVAIDGQDVIDKARIGIMESTADSQFPLFRNWGPVGDQIDRFLSETTLDHIADNLSDGLRAIGQPHPKIESASKPLSRHSA